MVKCLAFYSSYKRTIFKLIAQLIWVKELVKPVIRLKLRLRSLLFVLQMYSTIQGIRLKQQRSKDPIFLTGFSSILITVFSGLFSSS